MGFFDKAPAMQATLDNLAVNVFGRKVSDSLNSKTCVDCGKTVHVFTCEISEAEYNISALCQHCQDGVFG